ncbi:GNAT family N-acetyltransferase [Nocardia gipuzkoensis]|uniref:GNAT family N-acetyltransferase n=1 Tax=Nocardia gipuzkoensis TaxID=2749991 RepID=UPI00237EA09D|nr:GNAT family N-acetyltransferase [Nocardia gipuzkoensis]MDE1675072.1 GNAT family N-acetyltransferase [Nocardia gipuzkoensis]
MVSGLSLEDMSSDDAPIVNSWFRHDEASASSSWFPPGFRVDDELSQPGPAKSLKRADRRDQTVELLSAYAWVVRHPGTQAPMGWASGEVWPCHDFDSHIVEGQIPDDADDLPCATFQLAVAPSSRGRGHGTAILATIVADPRLRSTQIWLGIDVKNGASRTAAGRAGFEHEFTTAHYRVDGGEGYRLDLRKHMMHFRCVTAV